MNREREGRGGGGGRETGEGERGEGGRGDRERVTLFHNAICTRTKIYYSCQRVALHGCLLAKGHLPVIPSSVKITIDYYYYRYVHIIGWFQTCCRC